MDPITAQFASQLEDQFFARQDAVLIEQFHKLEAMERTQRVLAEVSGITDERVLRHLVDLGLSPDLLATLALVPLVEVAWADGEVQEAERKAILEGAASAGMVRGAVDYVLLEQWLKQRPPEALLDAWLHYVRALRQDLTPEESWKIKQQFMSRARTVAEAAGGLLGLFAISKEEQAMLDRMTKAFEA
jgi:hypothetical protein